LDRIGPGLVTPLTGRDVRGDRAWLERAHLDLGDDRACMARLAHPREREARAHLVSATSDRAHHLEGLVVGRWLAEHALVEHDRRVGHEHHRWRCRLGEAERRLELRRHDALEVGAGRLTGERRLVDVDGPHQGPEPRALEQLTAAWGAGGEQQRGTQAKGSHRGEKQIAQGPWLC